MWKLAQRRPLRHSRLRYSGYLLPTALGWLRY
jgi:hypothetical protein